MTWENAVSKHGLDECGRYGGRYRANETLAGIKRWLLFLHVPLEYANRVGIQQKRRKYVLQTGNSKQRQDSLPNVRA